MHTCKKLNEHHKMGYGWKFLVGFKYFCVLYVYRCIYIYGFKNVYGKHCFRFDEKKKTQNSETKQY